MKPEPNIVMEETATLAALCKASGDPLRLEILRTLQSDSFGVQELADIFSMPQPGMSHHLKVLAKAALLETRRQGNSIFYRRSLLKSDQRFGELIGSVYEAVDSLPLSDEVIERIEAVYEERSRSSQAFFEKHAEEFSDRHRQLCELGQYLPSMQEFLDITELPTKARVLEVGPGTGEFLNELGQRYKSVTALDNSQEMLSLAKKTRTKQPKIKFVQQNLESYRTKELFDLVVLNMVLHHSPSPRQFFNKIKTLLKENGFLLLADLCAHSQEWTRESCGDLWPGFEPAEVDEWANGCGLVTKQSLYLGLKNGFQIQLKLFQKAS